jgi:hypothetical protein
MLSKMKSLVPAKWFFCHGIIHNLQASLPGKKNAQMENIPTMKPVPQQPGASNFTAPLQVVDRGLTRGTLSLWKAIKQSDNLEKSDKLLKI